LLTPPPRVSASPTIDAALRSAAAASAEAERARDSVARAKASAAAAQIAFQISVAEAKRLHEQKSASENELLALYNALVAQEKDMNLLSVELHTASTALVTEKAHSAIVMNKLNEATKLAADKDAENAELRRVLEYSQGLTDQATKVANDAMANNLKLTADVGIEKGRTKTWRNITYGTGTLLLLSLGAHVLRSYMRI